MSKPKQFKVPSTVRKLSHEQVSLLHTIENFTFGVSKMVDDHDSKAEDWATAQTLAHMYYQAMDYLNPRAHVKGDRKRVQIEGIGLIDVYPKECSKVIKQLTDHLKEVDETLKTYGVKKFGQRVMDETCAKTIKKINELTENKN